MRYTWPTFVLVALIAGCQGDPATCRLAAGTEAVVTPTRTMGERWKFDTAPAFDNDDKPFLIGLGTRLTVIADEEQMGAGKPEGMRRVRANVRDGEFAGKVVKVWRAYLRPVPSR